MKGSQATTKALGGIQHCCFVVIRIEIDEAADMCYSEIGRTIPPGGIKISARLRSRGGTSPKLQDDYAPYSVTGGGGYKNLELG
jgi:hypothetical protein